MSNQLSAYFSLSDLRFILPMLIVSVTALLVMMLGAFHRTKAERGYLAWVSIMGLVAAGADSFYLFSTETTRFVFGRMMFMDGLSNAFNIIFVLSGILSCLVAPSYLRSHRLERGEFYALLLFSIVGMMVMVGSADLFTVFIGLEMMSIPVYCMAGFFRHSSRSAESAMKYFVLGAFSSALFLYGIAFIYGITGSTNLMTIASAFSQVEFLELQAIHNVTGEQVLKLATLPAIAMVLVLVAFGFKVGAVPFHMWTPDAYQGAPSVSTGFMATAVKAAAFGGMIRVFVTGFWPQAARNSDTGWLVALAVLAVFTVIVGNVVAIVQKDVKRMLAYSSIAHAGYLLVGFTAASYSGVNFITMDAVLFYLIAYTFATIGAFAVLAHFGKRGEECTTYDDLAGIAQEHPGAALAMTIFMLSSAGIPPTAGFVGKFLVFKAAVETGQAFFITVAIIAVLFSVAGIYYYLRLIISMYMKPARREAVAIGDGNLKAAFAICALATLLLGVMPSIALDFSRTGVKNTAGLPSEISIELRELKDADDADDAGAQFAEPEEGLVVRQP